MTEKLDEIEMDDVKGVENYQVIMVQPISPGYANNSVVSMSNKSQQQQQYENAIVRGNIRLRKIALGLSITSLFMSCLCCISIPALMLATKRMASKKTYQFAIALSVLAIVLAVTCYIVTVTTLLVILPRYYRKEYDDEMTTLPTMTKQ